MIYSQNLVDYKLERVITALIEDYNSRYDDDVAREGVSTSAFVKPIVIVSANDFTEVDVPQNSGNWLGEIEVRVVSDAYDQNSTSTDNMVLDEHKNRTGIVRDILFGVDFIADANKKAMAIDEPLTVIDTRTKTVGNGTDEKSFVSITRLQLLAVPDYLTED